MDARFCYLILRQRNGGNAMAFGERLQEVRKRSGLTQEEFAEQLLTSMAVEELAFWLQLPEHLMLLQKRL